MDINSLFKDQVCPILTQCCAQTHLNQCIFEHSLYFLHSLNQTRLIQTTLNDILFDSERLLHTDRLLRPTYFLQIEKSCIIFCREEDLFVRHSVRLVHIKVKLSFWEPAINKTPAFPL